MLVYVRWTSRGGQVGKREVMLNEQERRIVLTNQRTFGAKCLAWLSCHAARLQTSYCILRISFP